MAGRFILLQLAPLVLLTAFGCNGGSGKDEHVPARLALSASTLEFGEAVPGADRTRTIVVSNTGSEPLGLQCLELATVRHRDADSPRGHRRAFTIDWSPDDLVVSGGSAARGGGLYLDSGFDTGDDTDPGQDTDTDTDPPEPGGPPPCVDGKAAVVLPPGARLPVRITFTPSVAGSNYDALIATTVGDPASGAFSEDLRNRERIAYLHGRGSQQAASVVVTPRDVHHGYVWPGECENRTVSIRNIGEAKLMIQDVVRVPGSCGAGWTAVRVPEAGTFVPGGDAAPLEVRYCNPGPGMASSQCRYQVRTDDERQPVVNVTFRANTGANPGNTPPTVEIHSPRPGHVHHGWGPIRMELSVFDADQPLSRLNCRIHAAVKGTFLSNCTPQNESGHVVIDVPLPDTFEPGAEVLRVTVTDDSGITRRATVPVIFNSGWPPDDDDGDGFTPNAADLALRDCDDTDPNTYPFAAEIPDGKDNNCNNIIDEGTDVYDDDGDGMTEVEGDCDDTNPNTYLGAIEILDGLDNNCNGIIDENTVAYDDDGDGFSEAAGDCNDADPDVHPAAREICNDGVDNNCNGLKDEQPCVCVSSAPMIVGQLVSARTRVAPKECIELSVLAYECDGDVVRHQWNAPSGGGFLETPDLATTRWCAPTLPSERSFDATSFKIFYKASDDSGHEASATIDLLVDPSIEASAETTGEEDSSGGCAVVPLAPAGGLLLLGLGSALLRRRRQG